MHNSSVKMLACCLCLAFTSAALAAPAPDWTTSAGVDAAVILPVVTVPHLQDAAAQYDALLDATTLAGAGNIGMLPTSDTPFGERLEYATKGRHRLQIQVASQNSRLSGNTLAPGLDLPIAPTARPGEFGTDGFASGMSAAISYGSAIAGAQVRLGLDGVWKQLASGCGRNPNELLCGENSTSGYRLFGQFGLGNAALTAFYFGGDTAGELAWSNMPVLKDGQFISPSRNGFGVQGTYAFGQRGPTVGIGYKQSSLESPASGIDRLIGTGNVEAPSGIGRSMWTIGVYHDVNAWFRFVAEYNHEAGRSGLLPVTVVGDSNSIGGSDNRITIGGFIFW